MLLPASIWITFCIFSKTYPVCADLGVGAYPRGSSRKIDSMAKLLWRGTRVAPDPVACRWEAPGTWVENRSLVMVFYKDKQDKMQYDKSHLVALLRPNSAWQPDIGSWEWLLVRRGSVDQLWNDRMTSLRSSNEVNLVSTNMSHNTCDTGVALHGIDLRGHAASTDLAVRHAIWISVWDERHNEWWQDHHNTGRCPMVILIWRALARSRDYLLPVVVPEFTSCSPSMPLTHEMVSTVMSFAFHISGVLFWNSMHPRFYFAGSISCHVHNMCQRGMSRCNWVYCDW